MIVAAHESGMPAASRRADTMHVGSYPLRLLDATGGDGRRGLGRDRARILDAFIASRGPAGTQACNTLRQRIGALMPPLLDEVFFTADGAQTTSMAIAMAWEHHRRRGQPGRKRVLVCARRPQEGIVPVPFDPQDVYVGRAVSNITAQVAAQGADRIAAIVIEPLGLGDGMVPLGPSDVQQLQSLCDRSGVLLICDETVAGLGRLGTATASQRLGLVPDMILLGEILTNDTAPLGVVVAQGDMADLAAGGETLPSAGTVAAACETLAVYDEENIFGHSADIEAYWHQAIMSLSGAPAIAAIRCLGLAAEITLHQRPGNPGLRGQMLFKRAKDYGLLTRVRDDSILLTPSLIITKDQIDEIVEKLSAALRKIT